MDRIKKRGLSHDNPIFLLNLKSNTMKNTMQRYGIFLILPNNCAKKYVLQHVFCVFCYVGLANRKLMHNEECIMHNGNAE